MSTPDQNILTLIQADQARTDFALIESNLELIMGELAQLPTRAFLCRMLLLATASHLGLAGRHLADPVAPSSPAIQS